MWRGAAAATVVLAVLTAGCAGGAASPSGVPSPGVPSSPVTAAAAASPVGEGTAKLAVSASFYPLQFVTERVGGDRVAVTNLTGAGVEPHDLELSPQDVRQLNEADLVVHLAGFQPAVDDAVAQLPTGTGFDVTPAAAADLPGEAHAAGDEHDTAGPAEPTGPDPHVWLDPVRLAAIGDALAERLATADPAGAAPYAANATRLRADLEQLDRDIAAGLKTCRNRTLVTSHAAFGYLARRYGLTQLGISGLSPEAEPSPTQLAEAARFVRANGVRTIYTEALVSPAVARTVAAETGAAVALLDPVEGLTASSPGRDYLEVMRANLASLRKGQPCP